MGVLPTEARRGCGITIAAEMTPDQEVSKRTRSVESLGLVGQGRTAEIFEWGEGRVLRLFRPGASAEHAQREIRASRCVNDIGDQTVSLGHDSEVDSDK